MSISLLYETQAEIKRLMIAGSTLASDDYRIKKLIPEMQQFASKVPAFSRVAKALQDLSESTKEDSPLKLLELSAMINAVLGTLGQTKPTGNIESLTTGNIKPEESLSFRKIAPIKEALTSKSSGRLKLIKTAREEKLFRDIRLIRPLISALSETNAEISKEIEESILESKYDLTPLLLEGLDLQGGSEHVKRVRILCIKLGEKGKDLFYNIAENGTSKMQVYALEALGRFPEYEDYLIKMVDSRSKDISEAALYGLSIMSTINAKNKVLNVFNSKSYQTALKAIKNMNTDIDFLTEKADNCIAVIGNSTPPYKDEELKQIRYNTDLLYSIVDLLIEKTDEKVSKLASDCLNIESKILIPAAATIDNKDIITSCLKILKNNSKLEYLEKYGNIYTSWGIGYAFYASYMLKSPSVVYSMYSERFENDKTEFSLIKSNIIELINKSINFESISSSFLGSLKGKSFDKNTTLILDEKWLTLFIKTGNAELLCPFIKPTMHEEIRWLISNIRIFLSSYTGVCVVNALNRINYSKLEDIVIKELEMWLKSNGYSYNLQPAISYPQFYDIFTSDGIERLLNIASESDTYMSNIMKDNLKKKI